ncbi:SPOR domain-containing protein [Thiohalophilus sp.]|uniref:SPOR domain-containing protein n=1 Tax=Thiohalophilus sp. TaxID=3028392 RepID=UPI002ACDA652|nr:SPOR domain-containing protein [Thiohalophilus sp.]MDZ7663258.1 SPOR domain-containing protein [Thiohalophilus sp.]
MDENQLKQRIVGAIVLVALAVIFIPMLLSSDRDGDIAIIESNIPPRPDNVARVKTLDIKPDSPAPKPVETPSSRTPVDEHTPEADDTPASDETPDTPASEEPETTQAATPANDTNTNTDTDPKAWAVQVGSFRKQSNALGLRDKLRDHGYRVFVERVATDKGNVYRVRVGPEVRRSKAEALQNDLQTKLELEGLVVAHP